jgi:hypothetical protein
MASAIPVRRSARLAEKAARAELYVSPPTTPAHVAAQPPRAPKKAIVEDTHYRNLTPEEMKADFELRTKMLPICEAIRAAAKRPRTNEDFKLIEKAAEKLYEMSRGIIFNSMDEFFIIDIIHISREAKIGDETHKWTIQACNNYINALKSRMENQPTRTFDPK